MKKKRLVFKPWIEKVLLWVFVISFILSVTVNDFNGFRGLMAWLSIIAIAMVSGGLLWADCRCYFTREITAMTFQTPTE